MAAPSPAPERLRRLLRRARAHGHRVLVLGMGNEMMADDAVGLLVARDLSALDGERFASVPVGIAIENAAHLVRRFSADVVLVVDAALGLPRGPWGFVPPARLDTFCHSTHSIPLSLFVRIWREDRPSVRVHFLGVRPHHSDLGGTMTPEVARARAEIVTLVREEMGAALQESQP